MKLIIALVMGVLFPLCSSALFSQSLMDIQTASPVAVTQAPKPAPFFDTHILVFFFASTCPHCHEQAPVLAHWAHDFGVRVDARSFDDKPLPGFEGQQPATKDLVDVAFAGRPIRYPALFVMNEATGALYPASFGALNEMELQARMDVLIPKIMQYEQGVSA